HTFSGWLGGATYAPLHGRPRRGVASPDGTRRGESHPGRALMLDPRTSAVPRPPSLLEPPPPTRRASLRRRLANRTPAGRRLVALRDEVRACLAEACA